MIPVGRAIAIPFNRSIGRITLSLRLDWLVNRMLRQEKFDIIHHHEPLVPVLSMQIIDNATCAQVATFHAFGGFSFSYWAGRQIGEHFLQKLDGRIAVSSAARHFVSRYFPGEYQIIPNGVDVDFYANAKPFPEYRDGRFNILFVGRLEPRKGAMYLLRAYAALKTRHPETRLILCNYGPQLGRAAPLVRRERLADVLFARPRLRREDKARFYKPRMCSAPRPPARSPSASSSSRRWPRRLPIVASDIHGYEGRPAERERPPRRTRRIPRRSRRRSSDSSASRSSGAPRRSRLAARARVRLEARHGAARGLLRGGHAAARVERRGRRAARALESRRMVR